jgi:hypothetical protein
MLKTVFAAMILVIIGASANADEYVRGHYRSNGTYVAPYHRSSRDSSYNNNWSVRPNVNPYTGRQGSLAQTWNDRAPSYPQQYGLYSAPSRSLSSSGYGFGR